MSSLAATLSPPSSFTVVWKWFEMIGWIVSLSLIFVFLGFFFVSLSLSYFAGKTPAVTASPDCQSRMPHLLYVVLTHRLSEQKDYKKKKPNRVCLFSGSYWAVVKKKCHGGCLIRLAEYVLNTLKSIFDFSVNKSSRSDALDTRMLVDGVVAVWCDRRE